MLHFRQVFEELVSEDAAGEPYPQGDRDRDGLRDDAEPRHDTRYDTGHDGVRDDATSVRDQDRLR